MKQPKKRTAGRPKGAANTGNQFTLDQKINYRCTEGYKETIVHLQAVTGKSATTLLHEALQLYAVRHLQNPQHLYYLNRII